MVTAPALHGCLNSRGGRLCCRIAAYITLLNGKHIIYTKAKTETAKCENSLKQEGKGSMLLLLGVPVSLQQRVSWHQRQQTDVCVHVCDTRMPVQAQFIPTKRLLHNAVKVNETLSNYLPCPCQSCKFNLPRASNLPPEDVSISQSHGCAVVLLERLLPWHLTHPSAQCLDLQPQIPDDSPWF